MKTNKYDSYEGQTFKYRYKYQWERRNRDYLKTLEFKVRKKDYIQPMVYRLRFYIEDKIIWDDFYVLYRNPLEFPFIKCVESWKFTYKGVDYYVTNCDCCDLIRAIEDGADNIKLYAVLKDES